MSRRIRGPVAGRLVEVTTRTMQSRFLLRPGPEANAIIKGVIGRAQERYEMEICAVVVASNHLHALLIPKNSRQLSAFMRYVNSNVARKIGRLYRWQERFWARRYQAIVVSDEEEAQVARLVYILRHGCKEGLVADPTDWPGVHFVDELCQGHTVVHGGIWSDQSAEYEARRRGKKIRRPDFESRYPISLAALPCWRHRAARDFASDIRGWVRSIAAETRLDHEMRGSSPLGARSVLRQSPHRRPSTTKKSPAPWVHAASKEVRLAMIEAYRMFVAGFRAAAVHLKAGHLDAAFPEGSFPPALPWVPEPRPGPA